MAKVYKFMILAELGSRRYLIWIGNSLMVVNAWYLFH